MSLSFLVIRSVTSLLGFALLAAPAIAQEYTFEHLAGSTGGAGWHDGAGSDARFYNPQGMASDSSGNLYVADFESHTIRKITPAGVVMTLAGAAGISGSSDGTGSAAQFNKPRGVAIDASGNVYVADQLNHAIRKVNPAGVVTTLAGLAGNSGSSDGTGAAARFNYPSGVAVDSAGNVYVSDQYNHTIRKITPAGVVLTLAGLAGSLGSSDGTGSTARFSYPSGLTVDTSGSVYVSDSMNHTIRKVTTSGVVSTLAGLAGMSGSSDGTGIEARFNQPSALVADSGGNIYVTDDGSHTIRKLTSDGVVTTLAGMPGSAGSSEGTGSAARFYRPSGIAIDGSGSLYVADRFNNTIRKVTSATVVTTVAGLAGVSGSSNGTGSAARFTNPAVATDSSGNIYVADSSNHTIRKMTPAGVVTTLAGLAGMPGADDGVGSAARFYYPKGVATDGSGNVYVADSNQTIRKVTPEGVVTTLAGMAGDWGWSDGTGSEARFQNPVGVAVDGSGNVYVADSWNNVIRKVTSTGVVTTVAGEPFAAGSSDGTGSEARFFDPQAVATDSSGNVYVADTGNHTIRKITPERVVTTVAGLAGSPGSSDGTGSAARFYHPGGMAVVSSGDLYIVDGSNHTIRKVTSGGVVTTLAGVAGRSGNLDGTGSLTRFYFPSGLAIGSDGNVYVADSGNHAMRIGRPTTLSDIATATPSSAIAGTNIQLGTSENGATSWSWRVVRREPDSIAELSGADISNPTFTPDRPGLFTFLLRAEGPAGVRYSTVDVNVIYTPPSAAVGDATTSESSDGSTATFNVNLSWGASAEVTVHYSTADLTAVEPSDYAGQSGTAIIAPGATSATITVPIVGDTVPEADERFRLVLSSPVNATIGDGEALATIVNDDAPHAFLQPISLTLDGNGILEAGEEASLTPTWLNAGDGALLLDGVASNVTGPAGATYQLSDGPGAYGTAGAGETDTCPDCYAVSIPVPSVRPAGHWDVTLLETINSEASRYWRMHVGGSFGDVAPGSQFYPFIERMLHAGVTTGCAPGIYCPVEPARREQIAAFIARAEAGGDLDVPSEGTIAGVGDYSCTAGGISRFTDVQPTNFFCRHVHYLRAAGLTGGCSEDGTLFCPGETTTRLHTAIFLARALVEPHGDAAVPAAVPIDAGTGLNEFGLARAYDCSAGQTFFADVPANDPFCRHVHFLWARGVIDGYPNGTFGGTNAVTREQMAKFLANAYSLQLNHAD